MQHRSFRRFLLTGLVVGLFLSGVGCDLEPTNPNNPSEEQVLTTAEGLRTLTVGMQELYATNAVGASITTTGLSSREIGATTTFVNALQLEEGGRDLPPSNSNVGQLWSANYRVVGVAEDIINNASDVNFTAGTRSGIVATARLFKGMALGNIALSFEQGPTTTNPEGTAEFVPRQQVLEEAVSQLNAALDSINSTPPSDDFTNNILASGTQSRTGIDLRNTIHAYRARLNLYAGNFDDAISAANQVDPSVKSQFLYDDQSQNPVWSSFKQSTNLAPRDSFGTQLTESGDERVAFFTNPVDSLSAAIGAPVDEGAVFTSSSAALPLYVPGEMPLIRAEAKLEQGAPSGDVISEIDKVRTKVPSEDPFGIGANLPPYSGGTSDQALRREILRQRRAELYLQGLALADSRRLGPDVSDRQSPGAFERNRNFYPYPTQERRNNPNTPPDPDF